MSAGDIATILTALAGVIVAYTAYRKVAAESFANTGKEWRDLLTEVKARVEELERDAVRLRKAVAEREKKVEALLDHVEALQCENQGLAESLGALQKENAGLKERVSNLESMNAELMIQLEKLEREKLELETKMTVHHPPPPSLSDAPLD